MRGALCVCVFEINGYYSLNEGEQTAFVFTNKEQPRSVIFPKTPKSSYTPGRFPWWQSLSCLLLKPIGNKGFRACENTSLCHQFERTIRLLKKEMAQQDTIYTFVMWNWIPIHKSLLKGAKCTGPILNAWLELKTNGWPWPYRVLGPPPGRRSSDLATHGVARADDASGVSSGSLHAI